MGLLALPGRLLERRNPNKVKKPKTKSLGFLASYEHMLASVCDTIVGKRDW